MSRPHRVRRLALGVVALAVVLWVAVFDAYSLVNRFRWSRDLDRLTAENAALEAELLDLDDQVEHADEPEVVERVAREQYGMRRPGEIVYRVAPADR